MRVCVLVFVSSCVHVNKLLSHNLNGNDGLIDEGQW